jgi:hypothetical protein
MLTRQLRDDRIEISVGPNRLRRTYCCEGVRTATVYLMAGRWSAGAKGRHPERGMYRQPQN